MFEVGQKIKCVAAEYHVPENVSREYLSITRPVLDSIYTVREITLSPYGFGVRLEEVRNKKILHEKVGLREPIFGANRFLIANEEDLKPKKKGKK